MWIRIVRNTLAAPVGQSPRPVDVGQTIDVDARQGQQLIALGKAVAIDPVAPVAPAPHLVGVEYAVDPAPAQAEKRKRKT